MSCWVGVCDVTCFWPDLLRACCPLHIGRWCVLPGVAVYCLCGVCVASSKVWWCLCESIDYCLL